MTEKGFRTSSAKSLAKKVIAGFAMIVVSPLIVVARIGSACGSDSAFVALGCLVSLVPGRTGSYLRVGYYMGTLRRMSPEAQIGFGSFFSKRTAEVGRLVRMGAYCIIGSVRIEDEVTIASRVTMTSGRHQHGRASSGVDHGQPVFNNISVGARSWIGEGSIIMAAVGESCIVGAGSVVVKPVLSQTAVAGNPATVLRKATATSEATSV